MSSNTIKVLIVDDEHLVRNLLKICIDWNSIGMEIIGEAASGEDAIELVCKYQPELIFTDICMNNMDGIEFADSVMKSYPNIKVVVISGYDDFKYAQRCIRAGIKDYLLKPINDEMVLETALKMKKSIEEEREALSAITREHDIYNLPGKKSNKFIDEITEYVKLNYGDCELTLSKVAHVFFINASYLSRIFKKEMGINFMEYLVRIRIERAIMLLNNMDLKAYEIGEKVGISDSSYFSTCFKKNTGYSISEYRRDN
ncbi:response regulator transcription factor [Clostridium sp.]|jgi:two-component system response regulator YesN|uniref:response regulator transcription factor n=1 Tax=Clostridium sp. TaxID=1506 RepID=UPI003EF04945